MRRTLVVMVALALAACSSSKTGVGADTTDTAVLPPFNDVAGDLPDVRVENDAQLPGSEVNPPGSDADLSEDDVQLPELAVQPPEPEIQVPEVDIQLPDLDTVCTPDCADKECGGDGCGGSCGECAEGDICTAAGTCCAPACTGLACGIDGCGGTCGVCDEGGLCQDGVCCYPACDGKECGDDACGGSCGQCEAAQLCADGHCQTDPVFIGCSDGTREGFLDLGTYPLIAACGGAWDGPGIHNVVPACNRESGNSGINAAGTGCNVTDLCAEGWHVCLGRDDVDYRSPLGCDEIMVDAPSPAFFLVRTSSTGAMNCAPDTIGEPTSINDIFGCGDLGCPANEASCEPLQVASHDLCKSIRNKPTSGCTCHFPGELDPGDPKYKEGDFENVFCTPNSGGCGWCKPLDYYNKKYGVSHPNAWDCGTNSTQEANFVTKSYPDQQGGVLCCQHQCQVDLDCDLGMVCLMSTCQLP